MNVKVRKGANIETDHYLTTLKLKFIPQKKTQYKDSKIQRINPELLKVKKQEFQERLNIESEEWEEIKTKVVKTSLEIAPLKRQRKQRWWNEQCEEALELRSKTWKKWHSTKNNDDYIIFKEQRLQTAKIIRKIKRNFDKTQLQQIDEDFRKNNARTFYKTF